VDETRFSFLDCWLRTTFHDKKRIRGHLANFSVRAIAAQICVCLRPVSLFSPWGAAQKTTLTLPGINKSATWFFCFLKTHLTSNTLFERFVTVY